MKCQYSIVIVIIACKGDDYTWLVSNTHTHPFKYTHELYSFNFFVGKYWLISAIVLLFYIYYGNYVKILLPNTKNKRKMHSIFLINCLFCFSYNFSLVIVIIEIKITENKAILEERNMYKLKLHHLFSSFNY